MKAVKARAHAKINLTFEILGNLDNGYHEVKTLMQSVDLFDEVTVKLKEKSQGKIYISKYESTVGGEFPMDESNLAVKALDLYLRHIGEREKFEAKLSVRKNIPIQAGLAGGSADAAASLIAINEAFDNRLSDDEILEIASKLGADVPFCVKGGLCVGTGKGDRLSRLPLDEKLYMILVKPRFLSVSTPMLFKLYDKWEESSNGSSNPASSTDRAVEALTDGNLEAFYSQLSNDFEEVFFSLHPQLEQLRSLLLELGCWTANLTGSGPTIYGTVADIEQGNRIVRKLIADRLNNPTNCYYKHGPLDIRVVASTNESAIRLKNETKS